MVPLSITLRNFLSYGEKEVTVDFSNMHVVCLSGENGHGKSALLDAITWALWGETRLGKQGHDQLIRIGADEMSVVLTFRVGKDVYRVKRQRSKKTTGANWEIQRDDGTGDWRPLTGTTSSDTGRTIQQIVRMSFNTFLNSAYLKQGRADEFVRQTSNRRKEILCDILELDRYDRLEEKAKARAKLFAEDTFDTERQANQAKAIIADGARLHAELVSAEEHLSVNEQRLSMAADERRHVDRQRSDLFNQLELLRGLIGQHAKTTAQLTKVQQEHGHACAKTVALEDLVKGRDKVESQYAEFRAVRLRDQAISADLHELHSVRLAVVTAQSAIDREQFALQQRAAQLRRDVEVAKTYFAKKLDLEQNLARLVTLSEGYMGIDARLSGLAGQKDILTAAFAELKSENEQLGRELAAEDARRARLLGQTENCSLCGSPLPQDRIEELVTESADKTTALAGKHEQLKAAGQTTRRKINETEVSLKQLEQSRRELLALNNEQIKLSQRHVQAEAGAAPLDSLCVELNGVESRLTALSFAAEARAQLTVLEDRRNQLMPLETEHHALSQTIRSLGDVERTYHELINADQELRAERRIVELSQNQLNLLEQQAGETAAQITLLGGVESALTATDSKLKDSANTEHLAAAALSESQRSVGRLQSSIEQCAFAEITLKKLEAGLATSKHEEELFKSLAAAFGKRGIQASIIESALPELQQYTNDILERLTDGDLRVFIDTTRLAKSRNTAPVETLEIKISDSLGTRPLEMYSGGEAFRVSFALRIALSKLLVRRAGAELQTLIIDEGFGTQDAKGLEKLVDAINAVKRDFDQILVITHIHELKEAFATRIEVYKTSEGSQLRVVHGDAIG